MDPVGGGVGDSKGLEGMREAGDLGDNQELEEMPVLVGVRAIGILHGRAGRVTHQSREPPSSLS